MMVLDVQVKDFEGRTLAYLYAGQTFVNDDLVKQGFARVTIYPPNVRFEGTLLKSEKEAMDNKRGIWATEKKK